MGVPASCCLVAHVGAMLTQPSRLQDYASGIVRAVQQVCKENTVRAPTIVTESGRALVSHHSVLVFDVISRYHSCIISCDSSSIYTHALPHSLREPLCSACHCHDCAASPDSFPCHGLSAHCIVVQPSTDGHTPHRRQGQGAQADSADADEAPQAEHHIEKAARMEEPSARVTPRGQALLQACARVLPSLHPTAESVGDSCMLTLSLRQVPDCVF